MKGEKGGWKGKAARPVGWGPGQGTEGCGSARGGRRGAVGEREKMVPHTQGVCGWRRVAGMSL